jgi:hypothetical protein
MYMDSVVVASLITVGVTFAILGYLGYYGYRHLRQEEEKVAPVKAEVKRQDKPRA